MGIELAIEADSAIQDAIAEVSRFELGFSADAPAGIRSSIAQVAEMDFGFYAGGLAGVNEALNGLNVGFSSAALAGIQDAIAEVSRFELGFSADMLAGIRSSIAQVAEMDFGFYAGGLAGVNEALNGSAATAEWLGTKKPEAMPFGEPQSIFPDTASKMALKAQVPQSREVVLHELAQDPAFVRSSQLDEMVLLLRDDARRQEVRDQASLQESKTTQRQYWLMFWLTGLTLLWATPSSVLAAKELVQRTINFILGVIG